MTKQNKLLVQGEYPLLASPLLAKAYGMAAATFLQKLHYCLLSSDAKKYKNRKYFYHTLENWVETLGFYSISTIKRVIRKLKQIGILLIEKLSKNKWLQTNYYAIDYKKLKSLLDSNETVANADDNQKSDNESNLNDNYEQEKNHFQNVLHENEQPPNRSKPKVTHEARCFYPNSKSANQMVGLLKPLQPLASDEIIQNMPVSIRKLYRALLQKKVDIHYDDVRLESWMNNQNYILQHIAYIKDSYGFMRHHWHSPEQLEL